MKSINEVSPDGQEKMVPGILAIIALIRARSFYQHQELQDVLLCAAFTLFAAAAYRGVLFDRPSRDCALLDNVLYLACYLGLLLLVIGMGLLISGGV